MATAKGPTKTPRTGTAAGVTRTQVPYTTYRIHAQTRLFLISYGARTRASHARRTRASSGSRHTHTLQHTPTSRGGARPRGGGGRGALPHHVVLGRPGRGPQSRTRSQCRQEPPAPWWFASVACARLFLWALLIWRGDTRGQRRRLGHAARCLRPQLNQLTPRTTQVEDVTLLRRAGTNPPLPPPFSPLSTPCMTGTGL